MCPFAPLLSPRHKLAQGVNLVVMLAFREGEDLAAKFIEPASISLQSYLPALESRGVGMHAHDFVVIRDRVDPLFESDYCGS